MRRSEEKEKGKMSYRGCLVMTMVTLCVMSLGTRRTRGGKALVLGCLEDCMEICMLIDGATKVNCQQACILGCEQLMGMGRRFIFRSEDNVRT